MNVLLIIVFILLAGGVLRGYNTGFIKEAAAAVRLLFAVILLIFMIIAIRSYMDHDAARTVTAVVGICGVSMIYKLVNYVVSFVELLGKLPLIKELNRVAGGILGGLEALVLVWAFMAAVPLLNNGELTSFMQGSINSDVLLQYISSKNYLRLLLDIIF